MPEPKKASRTMTSAMRQRKRFQSNLKPVRKRTPKKPALLIDIDALTYYPAIETKTNKIGNGRKKGSTKTERRKPQYINFNAYNGNESKVISSNNERSLPTSEMSSRKTTDEEIEPSRLLENDEDVILKYIESSTEDKINNHDDHLTEH